MSTLTNYNGLEIVTPSPSGSGGLALNNNFKKLSTHIASADPVSSDDSSAGFGVGSRWFNSTTNSEWICTDSSIGNAIWVILGADPFDQELNTTNSVEFATVVVGPTAGDGTSIGSAGLQRVGTSTNLPLVVAPKGSGALQIDSGGNSRGAHAVDLQSARATAVNVASGDYSCIAAGSDNLASGNSSHCEGDGCAATGEYGSHAEGQGATASGDYGSHAEGEATLASGLGSHAEGWETVASGPYGSHAEGLETVASGFASHSEGYQTSATGDASHAEGYGSNAGMDYQHAHAAGVFSTTGDAQYSRVILRVSTANATATELLIDSSDRMVLPDDSTWLFSIFVVARRTDGNNESAAYKLEGCIDRNSGAGSAALVGSVTKTVIAEDTAAWDVAASADTTNGALKITVTGQASKTVYWVATVQLVQVTG